MNRILASILALFLLATSTTSCKLLRHKSSKKAKANAEKARQLADSVNLALKNQNQPSDSSSGKNDSLQILKDQTSFLWQKRLDCNSFSTKAKMHYEGGDKSLDFVANIRLKKDSIIWVSVNVAGIVQVARAIITPDSFKAIVYTEREAYLGPISKANQILPEGIDFYSLQNLILGNPILSKSQVSFIQQDADQWTIRMTQENYIEQLQYNKTDSNLTNNQLVSTNQSAQSLIQILNNFTQIGDKKISTDRKLTIATDKQTILVDMNLNNNNFDEELTYPFSIPKNYIIK